MKKIKLVRLGDSHYEWIIFGGGGSSDFKKIMLSCLTQPNTGKWHSSPAFKISFIIIVSALIFLIPSFKYLFPFMILIWQLFLILRKNRDHGRFLFQWVLIALFLRFAYLCIVQFVPVKYHQPPFFFLDDKSYHSWSANIAERWHQGEMPRVWTDAEVGTLQTGYYYFVSGIYYVFGANPFLPLFLNPFLGALLCILVYRLAQIVFHDNMETRSVILVACNPVFWFWSSFVLKDTLLTLFFILTLVLYLEYRLSRNALRLFFFCLASYFLALLRIHSLFAVVLTILVYELMIPAGKKRVLVFCFLSVVIALVGRYFTLVRDIEDQIVYSFLNALPDAGRTHLGALKYIIKGIPRLFLAPYAWVFADYFTAQYFLYPGQWFLYLYVLPFAVSGAVQIVKENRTICLFILFPIIVKGSLYLMVLSGSAQRHMVELMPLITILAAYGIKKRLTQKFMILYFGCLIGFMLVQFAGIVLGK